MEAGPWWLIAPEGLTSFLRAVHAVRNDAPAGRDAAVRLREWGFNAVGAESDRSVRDDGISYFDSVQLSRCVSLIAGRRIRLPDVFDPEWSQRANLHAASVCAPAGDAKQLIGWLSDDDLAWGDFETGRTPSLLQVCLSLEPTFASYHAAWEFVLAAHGGRLESLARNWSVALPNKETVRERTRAESPIDTRGHRRDAERWLTEFARRYFVVAAGAVRSAAPQHLYCGCRSGEIFGHRAIAAAAFSSVDLALVPWQSLPEPNVVAVPMLADNLGWIDDAGRARRSSRRLGLTTIERRLRRGRTMLQRLARHPNVIGYAWGLWHDGPGDQPPFGRGLVRADGTEARENTELLTEFNARADSLRCSAAQPPSP